MSYIISIVDFASHEFFRGTVLYVLKRSRSKSSSIIKEYILANVLTWDARPPCYSKNHAFHWCLLLLFTCSTHFDPFIKYSLEIYSTKINRGSWSSRYNRYHQARHKVETSIFGFFDLNIFGWDPWVSSLDTSFSLGNFSGLAVVFTKSGPWSTSSCRIYSISLVMVKAHSRVSSSNFHVLSTVKFRQSLISQSHQAGCHWQDDQAGKYIWFCSEIWLTKQIIEWHRPAREDPMPLCQVCCRQAIRSINCLSLPAAKQVSFSNT